MQLVILVSLANFAPVADGLSFAGAKSAVSAAKNFITGTRKTKSALHGTPLSQTAPGSVNTSGESDGIVKKSVDFLSNSAMAIVGLDTIASVFKKDEPVSIFLFYFSFPIWTLGTCTYTSSLCFQAYAHAVSLSQRKFILINLPLRYVLLICGIVLVTVGVIRLLQLCRIRNTRRQEISTFNAATML